MSKTISKSSKKSQLETVTNIELNVDKFKTKVSTFLNDNKNISQEIIQIANFVNNNPYIIENIIEEPNPLRCIACCYNKKQCSKNKKKNSQFCGIHIKKTPYGTIPQIDRNIIDVDVSLIEIKGIMCFIDDNNNVYQAEDVIQNKINPRKIGICYFKNFTTIII